MAALVEENPYEEWLTGWNSGGGDDFEDQPWHGLYFRAWQALRFDRQYGAMGGETPISYLALRAYAQAEGIDDWSTFHRFMTAIDDEWMGHVARAAKS